uniref:Uncharacterized protein n=1 Tax=Arundo donax TaxID=35708 RepID=A0A0A9H4C9_ARUDO
MHDLLPRRVPRRLFTSGAPRQHHEHAYSVSFAPHLPQHRRRELLLQPSPSFVASPCRYTSGGTREFLSLAAAAWCIGASHGTTTTTGTPPPLTPCAAAFHPRRHTQLRAPPPSVSRIAASVPQGRARATLLQRPRAALLRRRAHRRQLLRREPLPCFLFFLFAKKPLYYSVFVYVYFQLIILPI